MQTGKNAYVAVALLLVLSCSVVLQMSRAGLDKALQDLVDVVSTGCCKSQGPHPALPQ